MAPGEHIHGDHYATYTASRSAALIADLNNHREIATALRNLADQHDTQADQLRHQLDELNTTRQQETP